MQELLTEIKRGSEADIARWPMPKRMTTEVRKIRNENGDQRQCPPGRFLVCKDLECEKIVSQHPKCLHAMI